MMCMQIYLVCYLLVYGLINESRKHQMSKFVDKTNGNMGSIWIGLLVYVSLSFVY